jgi:hypothetical protein
MAVTAGELLVGEDPETPERKEAIEFLYLEEHPGRPAAAARTASAPPNGRFRQGPGLTPSSESVAT